MLGTRLGPYTVTAKLGDLWVVYNWVGELKRRVPRSP